jgi:hypothetical protein
MQNNPTCLIQMLMVYIQENQRNHFVWETLKISNLEGSFDVRPT